MTKHVALVGVVLLLVAARRAHAQAAPAKDCGYTCADVCRLADQYMQKDRAAQEFAKWAARKPEDMDKPMPPGVHDLQTLEDFVTGELEKWMNQREANGELPCPLPPPPPGEQRPAPSTELETKMLTPGCTILYNGAPLEGANLKAYEDAVGCKKISDATIAHEKLHQKHCQRAFQQARDPATAVKFLNNPAVTAESERRGYALARDMLEQALRDTIAKSGCGLAITAEPEVVTPTPPPPPEQKQKLRKRGADAAQALSKARKP